MTHDRIYYESLMRGELEPSKEERHAERCHANQPGDRQCNCHVSYGFASADDMDEFDANQRAALSRTQENDRG